MNELALYAGVGGGILGGILNGFKTICAVEIDPYCREVLLQRQRDGVLPLFPIWDDIKTFDGLIWNGSVDVITAGFPCQPFSVAGKNKGENDERNMWPDTIRVIREVRPRFALLENVPGLLVHPYFGTILGDLAESGYDCQWSCLGADDVGANHRRKRLWILCYPKYTGSHESKITASSIERSNNHQTRQKQASESARSGEQYGNVADAISYGGAKRSELGRRIIETRENAQIKREEISNSSDIGQGCENVADSKVKTTRRLSFGKKQKITKLGINDKICNASSHGFSDWANKKMGKSSEESKSKRSSWWATEPELGRVANELANRLVFTNSLTTGEF